MHLTAKEVSNQKWWFTSHRNFCNGLQYLWYLVRLSSFSMDFSMEKIISKPAVDPTHLGWQQEFHEKSIAEFLQSENSVSINDSDEKNYQWSRC